MTQIKFGTNGWRAVIAEDFTFANVERVAQAAADYWAANPDPGTTKNVVIRYDRRFLSNEFARRAAEVFAGNGFEVLLTPDATPTPLVSYAVWALDAVGGVMITASHNPPSFNGFKLKSHFGGSAKRRRPARRSKACWTAPRSRRWLWPPMRGRGKSRLRMCARPITRH